MSKIHTEKILLVDDVASLRHLVKRLLNDAGFITIVEAEDGLQAMKLIEEGGIELIVSDWEMPKMMGIELLEWVRTSSNCKNIPFIMVTSVNNKEDVIEASLNGVSAFLLKPFRKDTLIEAVTKALAGAKTWTAKK